MQSSLEKLRKLFRLEHEKRYDNKSVIGGLANILGYWEGEARNEGVPEEVIQATGATLRNYASENTEQRAESLKTLWKQIQEKVPMAAPAGAKPQPPVRPFSVPAEPDYLTQESAS